MAPICTPPNFELAGILEPLADSRPSGRGGRRAPRCNFGMRLSTRGLLLRGRLRASAAHGSGRYAGEGFAVVQREFDLTEPEIDQGLDDDCRVGAGNAVKAVTDGADLHAAELRVDLRHAKSLGHRQSGERHLS